MASGQVPIKKSGGGVGRQLQTVFRAILPNEQMRWKGSIQRIMEEAAG